MLFFVVKNSVKKLSTGVAPPNQLEREEISKSRQLFPLNEHAANRKLNNFRCHL